MLKLLFLLSRQVGVSPFPFVRHMSRLGLNRVAKHIHAISPAMATLFLDDDYNAEKDYGDNRFLANSWEILTSRLQPFLTETVVESLKGADFSVSDLLFGAKPITIYLRWPEAKLLALQPLMKLLWGTFLEELKYLYDHTTDKTRCR